MKRCTLVLTALLLIPGIAHAKRPDTPGGGTGDGSGYTVLVLDPQLPDAPREISAWDVNDHNSVVGYAQSDGQVPVPIWWMVSGGEVSATHLGTWGVAYGLNNHDAIVGERGPMTGRVAVYWANPLVPSEDLPLPDGHVESSATKINDHGFVVGGAVEIVSGQDAEGNPTQRTVGHAVAWRVVELNNQIVVSEPLLLGDLVPGEGGWAQDVSPAEEITDGVYVVRVCGMARDLNNPRAVTWDLGSFVDEQGKIQMEVLAGPTDLGTPPGESFGDAINARGDVCGRFGFRKLFNEPVEPLLPPSGIPQPGATTVGGMNDQAEIIGEYWDYMGEAVPVLWHSDGTAVDLNKYAKGTEWAAFWFPQAINNAGTIVGYGSRYSSGRKNSPPVIGAFMLIRQ